ncbi:hypothetical protein BRC61_01765 [Halobacteriales archaeon QH_10_65_19]|jgi:hypothetical protein|nr:MAG: hypothetical protein BRC61_01765 [Halobacteriales archaeon QH_10_65_19]
MEGSGAADDPYAITSVGSGDDGSPDNAGDGGTDNGEESTDDGDGTGFGVAVALGALLWVAIPGARRL